MHALSASLPFLEVNYSTQETHLQSAGLCVAAGEERWFGYSDFAGSKLCTQLWCAEKCPPKMSNIIPGLCEYVMLHGKGELGCRWN